MKIGNILLTLLTLLLLAGFALAVPSGLITEAAQERYLEETPSDDEYDFL